MKIFKGEFMLYNKNSILENFFSETEKLIKDHGIIHQKVQVKAQALTPEQAIGNPDSKDYPILKGREKMMKTTVYVSAEDKTVSGTGQAFTDHYGDYEGTLEEIFDSEKRRKNNFRRAMALAAANAFLQGIGKLKGAIHCKDKGPELCGKKIIDHVYDFWAGLEFQKNNPMPLNKILVIGHQPRLIQNLSTHDSSLSESNKSGLKVKAIDLDPDNFGLEYGCCIIESPQKQDEYLEWCELILATGSTFVNDSAQVLVDSGKPVIFYGISGAGVCELMGFPRFCPESTD
jgi:hypothetical protein